MELTPEEYKRRLGLLIAGGENPTVPGLNVPPPPAAIGTDPYQGWSQMGTPQTLPSTPSLSPYTQGYSMSGADHPSTPMPAPGVSAAATPAAAQTSIADMVSKEINKQPATEDTTPTSVAGINESLGAQDVTGTEDTTPPEAAAPEGSSFGQRFVKGLATGGVDLPGMGVYRWTPSGGVMTTIGASTSGTDADNRNARENEVKMQLQARKEENAKKAAADAQDDDPMSPKSRSAQALYEKTTGKTLDEPVSFNVLRPMLGSAQGVSQTEQNRTLREKFGERISEKSALELKEKENTLAALDRIEQDKAKVATDPVTGRVNKLLAKWGTAGGPDAATLGAELEAALSTYGKSISGATISVDEMVRLKTQLPQLINPGDTFDVLLRRFRTQVSTDYNNTLDTLERSGRSVSNYKRKEGATGSTPQYKVGDMYNGKRIVEVDPNNPSRVRVED